MGVDYSAFAGFGVPLKLVGDEAKNLEDPTWDLAAIACGPRETNEKNEFIVQEAGGRAYGGRATYVLIVRESGASIDVKRGGDPKLLGQANAEWYDLIRRGLERLKTQGVEPEGEVGWYVGGRVW